MAVEDDSYCAETDVEVKVGWAIGTGTVPKSAEVLVFQASRTGILYGVMSPILGTLTPGPAAYSVTVDTGTDAGLALQGALIHYNAVGAAIDTLQAAGASTTPAQSQLAQELFIEWEEHKEVLPMLARKYLGYANRTATHESVGEITPATVVSRVEDGFTLTGATKF